MNERSQIACLGYKQFKRVFIEYTGLNPKEFLKIARFRKTLHCLHTYSQIRLNELSYDWRYCDKSHLIKDFKTFTGYTPKQYLFIACLEDFYG
ncbi:helix-turn-helix domain-containing protein [Bacteroides bouchesdurhonensis]